MPAPQVKICQDDDLQHWYLTFKVHTDWCTSTVKCFYQCRRHASFIEIQVIGHWKIQ